MIGLPDDFVSYLSDEARSAQSAVHQYMVSSFREAGVHLFVEGDEDGSFYNAHARAVIGVPAFHYVCGGKSQVIEAYNKIRSEAVSNTLFFVDRDHQDLVPSEAVPEDVYVTDYYSFESYFVDPIYVSNIIADKLNLAAASSLHQSIVKAFSSSETSFAEAIRPFIALVLAIREKKGRLNLNNLPIDAAFSIDAAGLFTRVSGSAAAIRRATVLDDGGVTATDVLRWRRALSIDDRLDWVRGKYYLWAVFKYLQRVAQSLMLARKAVGERKGAVPQMFGNLAVFGAAAPPPQAPVSLSLKLRAYATA